MVNPQKSPDQKVENNLKVETRSLTESEKLIRLIKVRFALMLGLTLGGGLFLTDLAVRRGIERQLSSDINRCVDEARELRSLRMELLEELIVRNSIAPSRKYCDSFKQYNRIRHRVLRKDLECSVFLPEDSNDEINQSSIELLREDQNRKIILQMRASLEDLVTLPPDFEELAEDCDRFAGIEL